MLWKCESLNGSRLELTQVQERQHAPPGATYGKRLAFSTAVGELVKSGTRLCVEGCGDWRVNVRVRGVQAVVSKTQLSVGEHATMGGVAVVNG